METYEEMRKQISVYRDIEISERQVETGHVRDAREALQELKTKYSI